MEKRTRRVCVGIASGHKETHFVSCRQSENKLESIREDRGASLSLHSVSMTERIRRFSSGLRKVVESEELDDCFICLSMPGISHNEHLDEARKLLSEFPQLANANIILDDTITGLLAGIGSMRGLCAFSGSGSSVFIGQDLILLPEVATRPHKIDGYGPLLGDRGSGFKISVELLSKALISKEIWASKKVQASPSEAPALDQEATEWEKEVYEWLVEEAPELEDVLRTQIWFDRLIADSSHSNVMEIYDWLSRKSPELARELRAQPWFAKLLNESSNIEQGEDRIAKATELPWSVRLAHLNKTVIKKVDEAMRDGKIGEEMWNQPTSALNIACNAISKAAIEMANSTSIALSGTNDHTDLPIVCQGGMMLHSDFYFLEYTRVLQGYQGRIFRSAFPPVVGALTVAVAQDITQRNCTFAYPRVVDFLLANDSQFLIKKFLPETLQSRP